MRAVLLLAACIAAIALAPRPAHAQLVDRVAAFVDEEPIFLSEVRERAARFPVAPGAGAGEALDQALDALVDERLIAREAASRALSVTDDEVERAIASVMAQNGLADQDAFWSAVEVQGLTRAGYETELRAQILRMKVLSEATRSIDVEEAEVRREWSRRAREASASLSYRVSFVAVSVPEGASAALRDDARRRARELEASIRAGALTVDAAIQRSGGERAFWLSAADMAPHVLEAVRALRPEQVSPVLESAAGFQIIALHEAREGRPSFEAERDAIHAELVQARTSEAQDHMMDGLRRAAWIVHRVRFSSAR